jgi:TRAP-type C4-dicarboxylate transport system substrate-binding protein
MDKSGGQTGPAELSMALEGDLATRTMADFASRLDTLSRGALKLRLTYEYGGFASNADQVVLHDVADGHIDMGYVSTQGFATLGVQAMEAVSAPMLIANDDAASAFLDSKVPAQLLTAAATVGVHPLALTWEGTRVPVSVDAPILRPNDWTGLAFGTSAAPTQELAIRALGATPVLVVGPYRQQALTAGTLDGFELDARGIADTKSAVYAPYVAYQVGLWPAMRVLVINPDRYQQMTAQQRDWLARAADDASHDSARLGAPTRAELAGICRTGAHLVSSTSLDLRAMRRAFAPVYARLDRNPTISSTIEEIRRALGPSAGQAPSLDLPPGCHSR